MVLRKREEKTEGYVKYGCDMEGNNLSLDSCLQDKGSFIAAGKTQIRH